MPGSISDLISKISNGSQPLPTQLSADKNASASTASLDSATGWDDTTKKHLRIYKTKVENGITVPDMSKMCVYEATLSGTTLSSVTLVWSSTGTDQKFLIGDSVDLAPTPSWADDLADNVLTHANQDGSLKTEAVEEALGLSSSGDGWTPGLPVPTIVNNGNGSQTLTWTGSDQTGKLSAGMPLRGTRPVDTQTQEAEVTETKHWANTSTSGLGGITDEVTVTFKGRITSYTNHLFSTRTTSPVGFDVYLYDNGQLRIHGIRTTGNHTLFKTVKALPIGRELSISISMKMSTATAKIIVNGVEWATTTAHVGTFASMTPGSSVQVGVSYSTTPGSCFVGEIGLFDSVLSDAVRKELETRPLTGSEANCQGAWIFDGNATDLSSNGNDLTPAGGAGYVPGSPYSNGNGGLMDYAEIESIVFDSTDTVATVKAFDGCTLPETGLAAIAYTTSSHAYGLPVNERLVAFRAYQSSAQSIPHAVFTEVTGYDSVVFDKNANFASSAFVASHDGIYSFAAQAGFSNVGNGTEQVISRILLNGAERAEQRTNPDDAGHDPRVQVSAILELTMGDRVVHDVYQSNGGTATLSTTDSFLSGKLDERH